VGGEGKRDEVLEKRGAEGQTRPIRRGPDLRDVILKAVMHEVFTGGLIGPETWGARPKMTGDEKKEGEEEQCAGTSSEQDPESNGIGKNEQRKGSNPFSSEKGKERKLHDGKNTSVPRNNGGEKPGLNGSGTQPLGGSGDLRKHWLLK